MPRLGLIRIPFPVTIFKGRDLKFAKVLAESVTNQLGTVALSLTGSLVGRLQQFLVENNLYCFHMWTLFHNILWSGDPHETVLCGSFMRC